MIGWYVDVGHYTGNEADLTNIDQIIFTDFNRPITFCTTFNNTFNYQGPSSAESIETAINTVIESIGQDYYTIYAVPMSETASTTKALIKRMCPSYDLSFPNFYEFWQEWGNKPAPPTACTYFKSIGILITHNLAGRIFKVNNGVLTLLDTGDTRNVFTKYALGVSCTAVINHTDIANISFKGIRITPYAEVSNPVRAYSFNHTTDTVRVLTILFSNGNPDFDKLNPDNPYEPIEPSQPGGGDGTFDDDSDLIPDSSLPTLSSANTGFTRIYNPTLSQVQDLAKYLWTDDTLIETLWNKIKQYFEDPMQAIIGFNLVPVPVPDAGSKNFALMYIDTGVSMNVAASQFVDRDCGTFKLEPYYGSALDYSPYTKVSAYLPFIGVVQLDVDEVMGRTLQVKYRVDICSGSCVAKILVDGNVLYQYSGHCAINIPFAASDFSSYVQAAISVAKLGVAAAVAAAGGPPPVGAMDPSQQTNQVVTTTQTTETARNPMTGRQITTGTRTTVETREAPASQGSTQASFSALSPSNVSNTVGQIMSSKPVVNHSGSFSGNSGYLGVRRPYLIIERPNLCMPQNFQTMNGYPSMITMELSTCKGYTRVQQVQLTGLAATNPEQAEIQELLKSGVIF